VYAGGVILSGENIITTKKNKDSILFSTQYAGPKLNSEKNKYLYTSIS